MTYTEQDRAVLVALAKAAADTTPAPWGWFDDNDDFTGYYVEWKGHPNGHQFIIARVVDRDNAESEANAVFIAAARNAIDAITAALALADRAAELEAALAEERAVVAVLREEAISDKMRGTFGRGRTAEIDRLVEATRAAHRNWQLQQARTQQPSTTTPEATNDDTGTT